MTTKVDAYKFGLRIAVKLPPKAIDACQHITPRLCPNIQRGDKTTYKFDYALFDFLASGSVDIEFAVRGEDGRNYICARFAAIVKK